MSKAVHRTDWARMGLLPLPGVNAFQMAALSRQPEQLSKQALLARQKKYDAERRLKAKALRVNPPTNWCVPSGEAAQAKEIRQEIAKNETLQQRELCRASNHN